MSRARGPTNDKCLLSGVAPQAQPRDLECTFATHLLPEAPAADDLVNASRLENSTGQLSIEERC